MGVSHTIGAEYDENMQEAQDTFHISVCRMPIWTNQHAAAQDSTSDTPSHTLYQCPNCTTQGQSELTVSLSDAYAAVVKALKSEREQVGERFTWQADGLTMTLWPSGTLSLWLYSIQSNADCLSWPPGSPLANAVIEVTS